MSGYESAIDAESGVVRDEDQVAVVIPELRVVVDIGGSGWGA